MGSQFCSNIHNWQLLKMQILRLPTPCLQRPKLMVKPRNHSEQGLQVILKALQFESCWSLKFESWPKENKRAKKIKQTKNISGTAHLNYIKRFVKGLQAKPYNRSGVEPEWRCFEKAPQVIIMWTRSKTSDLIPRHHNEYVRECGLQNRVTSILYAPSHIINKTCFYFECRMKGHNSSLVLLQMNFKL